MEIAIELPLDWNLSKNKKYIGRTKKVLNTDYVACKRDVSSLVYREVLSKGVTFEKGKIWITIYVVKKNLRGDCINLIEGIADAIKTQIGVDDNVYSVVCDWFIGPETKVFVKIKQDKGNSTSYEGKK